MSKNKESQNHDVMEIHEEEEAPNKYFSIFVGFLIVVAIMIVFSIFFH